MTRHRAPRSRPAPTDGTARSVPDGTTRGLRAAVLRWYRKHRRNLPWRRTRDPYAIWVSEIMLQQTRVETVIPFYERFLERFPTVEALARAPESAVLAAWSGLGYYSRARSLRAAAATVVREHAGRLPQETEALRTLPGIGAYTAAAIASVAYGRPAAAVDGNVIRVLARIEGRSGRRNDPALRREVERLAATLASGPSPGDWTQALMELGALVCAPQTPRCAECPAASFCAASRSGDPSAFPEPARPPAIRPASQVLLLARRSGRVLLVPDPKSGAWGLPAAAAGTGAAAKRAAAVRIARTLLREPMVSGPVHRFRHRTYAEDLRFEVWEASGAPARHAKTPARWATAAHLRDLPLRSPTLKALGHTRKRNPSG